MPVLFELTKQINRKDPLSQPKSACYKVCQELLDVLERQWQLIILLIAGIIHVPPWWRYWFWEVARGSCRGRERKSRGVKWSLLGLYIGGWGREVVCTWLCGWGVIPAPYIYNTHTHYAKGFRCLLKALYTWKSVLCLFNVYAYRLVVWQEVGK